MFVLEKPSPWHLFTRFLTNSTFIVSRIVHLKLINIDDMTFPQTPYKLFPPIKNIFMHVSLFSSAFTHFFVSLWELA